MLLRNLQIQKEDIAEQSQKSTDKTLSSMKQKSQNAETLQTISKAMNQLKTNAS